MIKIRSYKNLVNENFFNRPQLDEIIINEDKTKIISIDFETLREHLGERIFFRISPFILRKKNLKSLYLSGKITDVRAKAIQINLSNDYWFPISQIIEVRVNLDTKQLLMSSFIQVKKEIKSND